MADTLAIWVEAARPKTLWAAVSPVLLGIGIAVGSGWFHPLSATLALVGALLIQVATNFHNDVADHEKGADREDRLGPRRMVSEGLITAAAMRRATAVTFALAVLSGVYLMLRGGLPIVAIGVASIIFGLAYTGGRYSLAYLGIADLFVFIFFGPVAVAGTVFVQTLAWPSWVWLAGVAPGLLCVNILLVNNLRDRLQDIESGKRTLIVRFGRRFGLHLYAVNIVAAALVPVLLWWWFEAPAGVLLSGVAIVPAIKILQAMRAIEEHEGAQLNPQLGATARILLMHSVLFALGWAAGPLLSSLSG
ncbi:MAG: 1,4-dihydroxy-2-naphthoate polyprenyltransferase [Rhodothermales bacterium]